MDDIETVDSSDSESDVPFEDALEEADLSDSDADVPSDETKEQGDSYGCQHYKRRCLFVAPCCDKLYTCRVCHDDEQTHNLDRKTVEYIVCSACQTKQVVGKACEKCAVVFGKYFCSICRLYDDRDKGQFHCEGCGLCRVGGRDNFFHCVKCDMCLGVLTKESHKCVEKMSRTKCPVCLDDLHTSRSSLHVTPCSHLMHTTCFKQMLNTGNYACPLCAKSMLELSSVWSQLDSEIAATPMPEEYRNLRVQILCRDCNKESRVLFHVLGLKCQHCSSYNTCRSQEPDDASESENVEGGSEMPEPDSEITSDTNPSSGDS